MSNLPPEIGRLVVRLREGPEPWDSERWMNPETLRSRPLLPLVETLLADRERGRDRLAHLCLFAARRVLPAWALYCDGRRPHEAVAALEAYLLGGPVPDAADVLVDPARPSFGGVPITDHRSCDTGSAAACAAQAVRYALHGDPMDAMECLSAAGAAIDQSPLVGSEDFVRWFTEVAIPTAWECRELTFVEREVYRDYDPTSVGPGGDPPLSR